MDPWIDRLSEYIDGELQPDERAAVERHLRTCADCREAIADLRAVVHRASSLSDRVPAADLWPGIEPRIARIRQPRTFTLTFSVAQLAAAAVVLLAVSAGLFWMLRPASLPVSGTAPSARESRAPATALPVRLADETYEKALDDLERALDEGRDRLDPRTIAIVEQNLKAIDAAIAQARQALEADPANTYLNDHLAQARRRKLALLQRVSAMANSEG
jgi:anti-sigma factor RsiW